MHHGKKQIAIIGRAEADAVIDDPLRMAALLQATHVAADFTGVLYEDLLFELEPGTATVTIGTAAIPFSTLDKLLCIGWFSKDRHYEDTVYALSSIAKAQNVACFNSETQHRSKGKLSQYVLFAQHGLSMPKTVFSHGVDALVTMARRSFEYPFIIKTTNGSRGAENYLVRSDDDLAAVAEAMHMTGRPYCAQSFIPNDGDLRVLVMDGQVSLVIHRRGVDGSHLNNTSQGGAATLVDPTALDPAIINLALDAARVLRREICGVDIMISTDDSKPYLLEVNNMPQLATGSFVPEKMQSLAKALAR